MSLYEKCQICGEGKALEWAHIVKSSYFRNNPKKSRHLKDFEKHIINMFRLCPTHHKYLDRGYLTEKQLVRLIKFKRKETKKIEKTYAYESFLLKNARELLERTIPTYLDIKRLNKKLDNMGYGLL